MTGLGVDQPKMGSMAVEFTLRFTEAWLLGMHVKRPRGVCGAEFVFCLT
jgi:hypothetical protein